MKKQEKSEIKSIFNELKKENKKVIAELYEKYNKIIYGAAFSILKNRDDSEDVVQTVFSKLYEIDKDKLPKDKEATWMYAVTKNEALMLVRKQHDVYDIEKIYNLEDEKNEIDQLIDKESYNQLINKLNNKEKEIVSLKILSNLSFKQISELLGESVGTTKWRYYKSIYTLRIMLSNLSMFIVTFIVGLATFKQTKKTSDKTVEDELKEDSTTTSDTENKENFRDEELSKSEVQGSPTIKDEEYQENIIVPDTVIETETNYLGYGMLGISAIFLVITIIFAIILKKHQLNIRHKSSK